MHNSKPCSTPIDTQRKLSSNSGDPFSDPTLYRSLAGALQYLTFTRPEITHAVQQVCLHMHDPRDSHFALINRILRYIKGCTEFGLHLSRSPCDQLLAYSDADWAGCPDTRKSTSGFCIFLGSNLLSWSSKRQHTVSRSSAEAEYRGVANAVAKTCWLRQLLCELHHPLKKATVVYCDNISAVYLSSNPVQHQRTKHIEIDLHFVRERVSLGEVRVLHVPSSSQHQSMWCRSSYIHAALTAVLQLRPARRWRNKLGQNSVLEPRRFRRQRTRLLSELLYGSSGSGHMKSIHVSPHVKEAVLRSLQSSYAAKALSGNGGAAAPAPAPARRVGVGGRVDWARYGFQTSWAWADDGERGSNTEEILIWHVGTRLFELKMNSTSASTDMIAACHLSYYCAYLVAVAPELLPDCAAWTKRRYKEVCDDVMRAAAALGADGGGGESMADKYEQLVQMLSKDLRDTVLRRGAELGLHLVEAYENEESACPCEILADFWSEMVLYVAPSENVKGHVQAMARGGEFITLVWALLLHAGVTTRPETPGVSRSYRTMTVVTRLFELKMKSTPPSPDMIAACHLSYYCAYLVAVAPELLPDCAAWTKRRYQKVCDDVSAALADGGGGGGTEFTYDQLVLALSKDGSAGADDSRDTVLRRGGELGQHLVEAYENEASACPSEILVDFWSEMLLYIAPSENVKGHVQAMARGGEFITLVWALLLHAGVTTRTETTPGGATAI
ncbi:hypothetical protein U9M48_019870, partial [Paspalum notatum var. saurae]